MADVLIRDLRGHAEAGRLPSSSPAPVSCNRMKRHENRTI